MENIEKTFIHITSDFAGNAEGRFNADLTDKLATGWSVVPNTYAFQSTPRETNSKKPDMYNKHITSETRYMYSIFVELQRNIL